MRVLLGLVVALGLGASASAQSLDDWQFTPPEGSVVAREKNALVYRKDGLTFRFFDAQEGETEGLIDEIIADKGAKQSDLVSETRDDGSVVTSKTLWTKNGAATITTEVIVFERDGQRRAFSVEMADGASVLLASQMLPEIDFYPSVALESVQSAGWLDFDEVSAKQPVDPNLVAKSTSKMDFLTARRMGLNPEDDLLPDTFVCYTEDEKIRPPNRPRAILEINRNGRYAIVLDGRRGQGRWRRVMDDDDVEISFSGPVEGTDSDGNSWMSYDELGQSFRLDITNSRDELACFQKGPKAAQIKRSLDMALISNGTMTCRVDGSRPLEVRFANGRYTSAKGNGRYTTEVELRNLDGWSSDITFTGGPFDGTEADFRLDDAGNRKLEVKLVERSYRAFSVSSKSTGLAVCLPLEDPHPDPIYGQNPAPEHPAPTVGLSGRFYSFHTGSTIGINGMMSMYIYYNHYDFRPDGWVATEDPVDLREDIDCSRTRPNGAPICLRYEIRGGRLRIEDEPGKWEDWYPFRLTRESLEFNDGSVIRLAPMTGMRLEGTYVTEGASAAGGSFSGTVMYNDSAFRFFRNGRVEWQSSRTASTYISPPMGMSGAIGGGSSTRGDIGKGTYQFTDNWLDLSLDDGRQLRFFVHDGSDGWSAGQPAPKSFSIDSDVYERR